MLIFNLLYTLISFENNALILIFMKTDYQILQNLKKTKIIYRLMPVSGGSNDFFAPTYTHW
jgi:hypothetical protein